MNAATANSPDLIDEIIRMSDFSFQRLPMLDIIGSRLAGFLPIALSELTRSGCEASLTQLDYIPLGQAISGFPDPALIAVSCSPVLDGSFLIVMDAPLVWSSLETSLGGAPSGRSAAEGDEFTPIERGFGMRLADLIMGELRQSFSVIGDIVPEIEGIETDAEAAAVTQHANLCVRLAFGVKVSTEVCRLQIIFPYDTLEPIRPQLSKVYFGDRGDAVSPWRNVLEKQIEAVTVELEVVLKEMQMPMRQIMSLKPGDKIALAINEENESTILCSGSPIFRCLTGKRNNGVAAVQITEEINTQEEA